MLFFILTLGASVCFAFGNILSKSGITKFKIHPQVRHPFKFIADIVKSGRWWLGVACSALGNAGSYTAMALFNLSLVKPMLTLNPVLTAIFGHLFLKEKIDRTISFAIVCILGGLLCGAVSPDKIPATQHTAELWAFSLAIIVLATLSKWFFKSKEVSDSIIMGAGYGLSDTLYKSLSITAMAKGITLSANEALLWITDPRVWVFIVTYGIAFLYTQVAFSRGRALFVIPLSAAIGSAVPILAAKAVFQEPFPIEKVICVTLIFAGSALFVESARKTKVHGNR